MSKRKTVGKKKDDYRKDWLYDKTGKDTFFWMIAMEHCISSSSVPITRGRWKGHGKTDVRKFLSRITYLVYKHRPNFNKKPYDSNMYMAAVLGYIFTVWFVHVQTAKAQDPRRPIENRMEAMARLPDYRAAMEYDLNDEYLKYTMFKGQEYFEPPYTKNATNGKFV